MRNIRYKALSTDIPTPPWLRGEIELLKAMIDNALTDIRSGDSLEKREAREWLFDSETSEDEPFSSSWVLDNLGIDPGAFREAAKDRE